MNSIPTKEDLISTHARIQKYIHRTPVITCSAIDEWARAEVYFKCENLQKVGAFKARGGINAVRMLMEKKEVKAVATHSSGNHAQALARAAKISGVKAYIVMPSNAPQVKKEAVRGYGAEIIECEPTLASRESTLDKVVEETGADVVHPYNDYRVIAGQATAAMELLDEYELDAIITPVGGGGLLAGSILASKYFGNAEVYAGEPEGADDAHRSFTSGQHQPSIDPNTIADGLLTSVGEKNWEIIQPAVKDIITVSDEEILEAMKMLWERAKLVVEPSGAVPLAAIKKSEKLKESKVGCILSGGNVDISKMLKVLQC